MDHSPPGSLVHGILQARILERVAIPFSKGSSPLRDWNQVSHIAGRFLTIWATREVLYVCKAPNKCLIHCMISISLSFFALLYHDPTYRVADSNLKILSGFLFHLHLSKGKYFLHFWMTFCVSAPDRTTASWECSPLAFVTLCILLNSLSPEATLAAFLPCRVAPGKLLADAFANNSSLQKGRLHGYWKRRVYS